MIQFNVDSFKGATHIPLYSARLHATHVCDQNTKHRSDQVVAEQYRNKSQRNKYGYDGSRGGSLCLFFGVYDIFEMILV